MSQLHDDEMQKKADDFMSAFYNELVKRESKKEPFMKQRLFEFRDYGSPDRLLVRPSGAIIELEIKEGKDYDPRSK